MTIGVFPAGGGPAPGPDALPRLKACTPRIILFGKYGHTPPKGDTVRRQSLWFEGRERVSVRDEAVDPPGSHEVLIETLVSAISPGTEMLFYHGELEEGTEVDVSFEGYRRRLEYPLPYGYSSVGRISRVGPDADASLAGRLAFVFMPHASAFLVPESRVVPVPDGIEPEDAAFLASAETAVNLVMDAAPLLGERASVFGLGVIGLLTAGVLGRFPLASLSGWDLHPRRRDAAGLFGVAAQDPVRTPPARGTEDLAIEVSGSAEGFRLAAASCRFSGRLVVGSWFGMGSRRMSLQGFDTSFHRNRVRIISSQVSTIDPALSARWSRQRRLETAWDALRLLRPSRLITHRVPFARAQEAYGLIAGSPAETIQVMLVHGGGGSQPLPG
jgi:2-desacetyl-2-hydroxyethyl bacteriochlorophyllide A dehydrogenase